MRPIHVAVAASVLTLVGCGVMPVPSGSGTPTLSPSPSASVATPTPTPATTPEPSEILFTISATLTSPVGAVAHLEQVIYAPTSDLNDVDSVTAQLDQECDGWRARFGQPDYLVGMVTATDLSTGGKKWSPTGQVVVSMAGTAVYQGDYTTFQSYCSSVQVLIPGSIRGVTPVPADGSPDSAEGWATLTYGFGIDTEPGTEPTDSRYSQLSDCAIKVTALGKKLSATAAKWTSSTISRPGLCQINHPGV